jgi:hypothetical protein
MNYQEHSDGQVSFNGTRKELINHVLDYLRTPLMDAANSREENDCSLCKQSVHINKDKQTDSSTINLLNLYYLTKTYPTTEYFKSSQFCKGRNGAGRFAALRHHNIIEEAKANNDNTNEGQKKNSGMWKLTDKGIQYCEGKVKIPKYILTYNRQFIGTDGELMGVEEFLKEPFHYKETMEKIGNTQGNN